MTRYDDQGRALIGPNSVLQLIDPIERHLGRERQKELFALAGYEQMPTGEKMIHETGVAQLHRLVSKATDQATAMVIVRQAGEATAQYILDNRIPKMAQRLLKALPKNLAAKLLAKAIEKHAWTFAGSGEFDIISNAPLILAIKNNPLAMGEKAEAAQCHWHCAVFTKLFNTLAGSSWHVKETHCCSMGFKQCRFVLLPCAT